MAEFLIALRDEANWLDDDDVDDTFYLNGFSADALAKAITNEVLWRKLNT